MIVVDSFKHQKKERNKGVRKGAEKLFHLREKKGTNVEKRKMKG